MWSRRFARSSTGRRRHFLPAYFSVCFLFVNSVRVFARALFAEELSLESAQTRGQIVMFYYYYYFLKLVRDSQFDFSDASFLSRQHTVAR